MVIALLYQAFRRIYLSSNAFLFLIFDKTGSSVRQSVRLYYTEILPQLVFTLDVL